jgi:hypothetical protein
VPVFLLIFPQKYEDRPTYLNQGKAISRVLRRLESEYIILKLIEIEEDCVSQFEIETNRYHFDNFTKSRFVEKVEEHLIEMGIS